MYFGIQGCFGTSPLGLPGDKYLWRVYWCQVLCEILRLLNRSNIFAFRNSMGHHFVRVGVTKGRVGVHSVLVELMPGASLLSDIQSVPFLLPPMGFWSLPVK